MEPLFKFTYYLSLKVTLDNQLNFSVLYLIALIQVYAHILEVSDGINCCTIFLLLGL